MALRTVTPKNALPWTPPARACRINAAANAFAIEWARANLPPDSVARALARWAAAGVDVAEAERASGWVPFETHAALLDALAPEMGARRFFELGVANAAKVDRVVPGASLLLKLASPKRLMGQAPRLWSSYVEGADARVEDAGANQGRLAVTGIEASACFWETMSGFIAALLERTGARAPVISRVEDARGAVLSGTWN